MAHAPLGRGYLGTSGSDPVGENKKQQKLAEPLLTALEHIEERGSLLGLVSDRAERLSLMKALADQEFVAWNAKAAKYELTSWGRQCRKAPRA
jgi:hypothetical protein